MSMPLASWSVQIGVMARRAALVSFQRSPCMEPLSSMRKMVSKEERKAYLSSAEVMLGLERAEEKEGTGEGWRAGSGEVRVMLGAGGTEEGPAMAEYGGGGGRSLGLLSGLNGAGGGAW